jgi:hypothetical protein
MISSDLPLDRNLIQEFYINVFNIIGYLPYFEPRFCVARTSAGGVTAGGWQA